ncbi:MAG: flagellar biosynthetic protein FliO [Pseudomonadota bacterium]|nr:flagellar biosynthetic protein FliO [Pseudomonadota bacterium]
MKHSLAARLIAACLLYTPALFAAQGDVPRRFAAPDAASATTPGSASGIGQVMLALVLVLAAVFAVAWLIKRMRGFSAGGATGIEVVAQAAVGPKERVVIVRVAGSRLLLGVAAGQVSLLQTLPAEPESTLPPASMSSPLPPRFTELLRRSLGK